MGTTDPWTLLVLLAGSAYVARLWLMDYRAARAGAPLPQALPGATPANPRAVMLACAGALFLLGVETVGEFALGISQQQSRITVLFGAYTLAAAFVEELIFRGYVVLQGRGHALLVTSCIGASLLFAALHPHLWSWGDQGLSWHFHPKAWFSTAMIFLGSLWFYWVRFWSLNPTWSLLPCIAAHATKNAGVLAIKLAGGYVTGWW